MNHTVTPFLMFEGKAEEAMKFYTSLIPNSSIIDIKRYGADGPGVEGTVMKATLSIGGLTVKCNDSYVHHEFSFTPSISLFLSCRSEQDIDHLATALGEGGKVLMPLNNYGFSRKFAWVNDRFGVSWQLNFE